MYKLVVPGDIRELIGTMHPALKKKVFAFTHIPTRDHTGDPLLLHLEDQHQVTPGQGWAHGSIMSPLGLSAMLYALCATRIQVPIL